MGWQLTAVDEVHEVKAWKWLCAFIIFGAEESRRQSRSVNLRDTPQAFLIWSVFDEMEGLYFNWGEIRLLNRLSKKNPEKNGSLKICVGGWAVTWLWFSAETLYSLWNDMKDNFFHEVSFSCCSYTSGAGWAQQIIFQFYFKWTTAVIRSRSAYFEGWIDAKRLNKKRKKVGGFFPSLRLDWILINTLCQLLIAFAACC